MKYYIKNLKKNSNFNNKAIIYVEKKIGATILECVWVSCNTHIETNEDFFYFHVNFNFQNYKELRTLLIEEYEKLSE